MIKLGEINLLASSQTNLSNIDHETTVDIWTTKLHSY